MMTFSDIFPDRKPVIGCIHLLSLPGSPRYSGDLKKIFATALAEAEIYKLNGLDGLIIENFRDHPFYPGALPPETVAAMAAIAREVVNSFDGPVGINALRNDAEAAMAIATASGADFIRVNVHTGAAVTDQGVIEGKAHETLRLRKNLHSEVLVFADVHVKHASPLGNRSIEQETIENTERGMANGLIVSGTGTGMETALADVKVVKQNSHLPVLIGSGTTIDNIHELHLLADGFIVGSFFKKDGKAVNEVDPDRVKKFMDRYKLL